MAKADILCLAVLLSVCLHVSFSSSCAKNWFGDFCQYKCHCASDSDVCDPTTGDCHSRCAKAWFGPACQYVDLAHDAKIGGVGKAVHIDGNDMTCDSSEGILSLSLTKARSLEWIRIMGDRLEEVNIFFSKSDAIDPHNLVPCGNMRTSLKGNTLDVYCQIPNPVKTIVVVKAGWVCSVYLSGGRNVALKERSAQVGDYRMKRDCFTAFFQSSFAVDGRTNGDLYKGSCMNTIAYKDAWWTVFFSSPRHLMGYKLYSRTDHNTWRMDNYRLEAFSASGDRVFYVDGGKYKPVFEEEFHRSNLSVSSVTVISGRGVEELIFCELEVFGDSACPSNRYGRDCEHMCNCRNGEPCFVSTGACPSGCSRGWLGDACNLPCPGGTYGVNCSSKCSSFCVDNSTAAVGVCHHVTGTCLQGCRDGYQGLRCTRKCRSGLFGQGCSSPCSEGCDGDPSTRRTCDHRTGACLLGCFGGYTGLRCTEDSKKENEWTNQTDHRETKCKK